MAAEKNKYNSSHLLKYIEFLIKETRQIESKFLEQSNYSWLKSKNLQTEYFVYKDFEELKPMIQKLTPESCTSVAVKLDILTERITSTKLVIATLKNLLQEEDSMTLLAGNVKRGKQKLNKVHPVMLGR